MAFIFPSRVAKDKKYFRLWEKKGFHITPVHFYEPIPDTTTLKDDLWKKQSELVGININEKEQIKLLSLFSSRYKEEYDSLPRNKTTNQYQYYINNQEFGSVDGEILYCMNRHFKPKRIVEIGSGYSTLLSAQGVLKNREEDSSYECDFVAIEPHPSEVLKNGFPGLSKLFIKEVQDIPLLEFEKLRENDVLFIDSSHVLKIGGDVQYEYLEILPRLQKGVLIHVHDIFLPAEYRKEFVLTYYHFWNEQYLLQAFLTCNDCFEVTWAGSYMHLKHPQTLEAAFSSYKRNESWPGSFWMRKIK
jgi:hypothetical protein